jgi:hypothetical protein
MKNIILLFVALSAFACQNGVKQHAAIEQEVNEAIDTDSIAREIDFSTLKFIDLKNDSKYGLSLNEFIKHFISVQHTDKSHSEDLTFMKEYVGKYPSDIKFFDIPSIKSRLMNLVGNQFNDIIRCKVEAPIKSILNNYIHVSICLPHECSIVHCEIFVNYSTNNISLFYKNYDKLYCYSENGKMELDSVDEFIKYL